MSSTDGMPALNWNTILCLVLMLVATLIVCGWAIFELNGGGLTYQHNLNEAGTENNREDYIMSEHINVEKSYSIFASRPVILTRSHSIADHDAAIEMTTMQNRTDNASRPHNLKSGKSNASHRHKRQVSARPIVPDRFPPAAFPINYEHSEQNVTNCRVEEDTDRARDRRILTGLNGLSQQ